MNKLFYNIRFYIIAFTIVISIIAFFIWSIIIPNGGSPLEIKLAETYALLSLGYLYITLLPSPLYSIFPKLIFRAEFIKARRALGVSTFILASIHAFIAFFYLLGGFEGLQFLSNRYLIAISLSTIALIILSILTITSLDIIVKKLGKKWNIIHKFIYLGSFLIIIHVLMLGTHFIDPSSWIYQIFLTLFAFLFSLEAIRIDNFFIKRYKKLNKTIVYLFTGIILIAIIFFMYGYTIYQLNLPISPHAHV